MQETWVQSLGLENSLEEGMVTHSSILAWRILIDRGAWQATVQWGHKESDNTEPLSTAHITFKNRNTDHILGHKASLGKFKKIEIIPSTFSDHNAVRLDLNYKRKNIKNSNIWRLNNTLLNNQQITEEIKKKSKFA